MRACACRSTAHPLPCCSAHRARAKRRSCGCSRASTVRSKAPSLSAASRGSIRRAASACAAAAPRGVRRPGLRAVPASHRGPTISRTRRDPASGASTSKPSDWPISPVVYPRAISSGQRQRVALARALAAEPALLLLDEPLSALDAAARARTRQQLRQMLLSSGVPSIVVTHDRMEAVALGDWIAVISAGRVRQCGPVQDVFQHPADAQVAESVGVENVLPAQHCGARSGPADAAKRAGRICSLSIPAKPARWWPAFAPRMWRSRATRAGIEHPQPAGRPCDLGDARRSAGARGTRLRLLRWWPLITAQSAASCD